MVGVAGFEPAASWTRTKRDTKLRHTPKVHNIIMILGTIVKGWQEFLLDFSRKIPRGDGMSYRIEYGTDVPHRFQPKSVKRYVRILTALSILLFALAVGKFWPEGRLVLQQYVLPGELSVTEQAFSDMISQLSTGENLEDVVVVFCQRVIDHGSEK